MTPTEHKITRFIAQYIDQYGYSPSVSQIMLALGHKSKGTIHRYLNQLVTQGELIKSKESGRNIYTPIPKRSYPFAGRIAAGSPIEAIPESERLNFFDRFTEEGLYQLEIKGDSMIDIGIVEGDIVLIKPTRKARNKEIVVALIDKTEVTLKRYYERGKHIELFSENKRYQPQIYTADRVEIQGILHSVHKFSF